MTALGDTITTVTLPAESTTTSIAIRTSTPTTLTNLEPVASSSVDGTDDKDAAFLASLGYKQELKRHFSPLELFGISFSIIGIVPSIASVLIYAIPFGGPVAMIWGWAFASFFLLAVALAIAELGSSIPTAGGLYWWTYHYASPRTRTFLCWLVAYNKTLAYLAATASIIWGLAVQVMAAVSIASDLEFVPTTAETYGVYFAFLVIEGILSSMATKVVARLQRFSVGLQVVLCLVILVGLPTATPVESRNSVSFAFKHFENLSDWPNGLAFVLSFLAPLWCIAAFDSSTHISEEAKNANVAVPWAIVGATIMGIILGFAINIIIAFNMGPSLSNVVDNPIGQPMAVIILNAFGKRGTLVVWSFVIISQFMTGNSFLIAASRQLWAFSRDSALPFSPYLYRINSRTGTPLNCVWFIVSGAALLGLLSLAGEKAISAVFKLAVGQYVSYSIPIIVRWVGGGSAFRPGPFSLGILSPIVSGIALAWMVFTLVICMFPSSRLTAPGSSVSKELNYAPVVLGGAFLLSIAYYFIPVYGGRYWFIGPTSNTDPGEKELPKCFDI